jgi:hypothetical protein
MELAEGETGMGFHCLVGGEVGVFWGWVVRVDLELEGGRKRGYHDLYGRRDYLGG